MKGILLFAFVSCVLASACAPPAKPGGGMAVMVASNAPLLASSPPAVPDVTRARQLYCNGTCTWAGGQGCDQADADVFCKLKTGTVGAYALRFKVGLALEEGGFACPQPPYGRSLGPWREANIADVHWQDTSIRANHGAGDVVYDVECTTGPMLAR